MVELGRTLIVIGLVLVLAGVLVLLAVRIPLLSWLGRLPGDLIIRRGPVTIYLPILTSIVLSILLTLILAFLFRR